MQNGTATDKLFEALKSFDAEIVRYRQIINELESTVELLRARLDACCATDSRSLTSLPIDTRPPKQINLIRQAANAANMGRYGAATLGVRNV